MKKKVLIISIITLLVIVLVVTLILVFMNKDDDSQPFDQKKDLPVNVEEVYDHEDENNEPVEEVNEVDSENDLSNEIIEESKENIPNNSDQTNVENNNSNQQNNNSQNVSDSNESVEEPQDTTPEEIVEKTVCTNDDLGYQNFLTNYKSMYPTYFTFNSESEAIAFGEMAMNNYGYIYQRNTLPVIYDGNNCSKEIWYVRLTIAKNACTKDGVYNDVIHIPATSMDLVSIHDYLRSLGYDCGNKR